MTLYYAKSTNGFYDSEISSSLPSDAVIITPAQKDAVFAEQAKGKRITSDDKGYPIAVDPADPTKDQIIFIYESAAQKNLDTVAKSWGYDSILSAVSYANSTNPQYKADAAAMIEWRDAYWAEAYNIEAGTLPASADAFVSLLPPAPARPVIN